jgi:serine phosphatase RsbU (regulator of sigma subunit)
VAGDFYWLGLPEENHGQSYVFVGACDSTGHGVPGALVSVVCSKALEKSFHEFKIDQPASLLDKVSELVTADFARNNTEGDEIKDGMDASIIKIFCDSERTHVNAKIVWAGANNPLVYVLPDGTLHEIKADKQPVGKTESIRSFTQHELELPHGTMVYLFTDGYSDQFGGTEGKKLTKKVFKDLLKKCFNQPGKEQRVFLKKFIEEYRGKEEQVDDICVIGVRVNR